MYPSTGREGGGGLEATVPRTLYMAVHGHMALYTGHIRLYMAIWPYIQGHMAMYSLI